MNRLKELRKERGYTQIKMQMLTGIDQSDYSKIESGKIIYDGKDLVRISEEDMVKLRGDKIAMIFQDPMSSLNPIMRVGNQLTEAMILKAKTGKKNLPKRGGRK